MDSMSLLNRFYGPRENMDCADELQDNDDVSTEVEKSLATWSGSGIWERVENRRWEAVANHVIPRIDPSSLGDSSLVVGLGVSDYIQNFENETDDLDRNSRVLRYGDTVIRISDDFQHNDSSTSDVHQDDVTSDQEDPTPGPSGTQQLPAEPSRLPEESVQADSPTRKRVDRKFIRSKRNRRKRKKNRQRRSIFLLGNKDLVVRSANSSPGRRSPSPNTIANICLYWEERLASPEYIIHSDSD